MSAPSEECSDLKGGHPPAVKAGGMRITQHKTAHNEKPTAAEPNKEDTQEGEEEVPEEEVAKPTPLVISGAVARGDVDFPAASVKAFHEKTPQPKNEFQNHPTKGKEMGKNINQPRK